MKTIVALFVMVLLASACATSTVDRQLAAQESRSLFKNADNHNNNHQPH